MGRLLLFALLALAPLAAHAQPAPDATSPAPDGPVPAPDDPVPAPTPAVAPIRFGLIPFLPEDQLRADMAPLMAYLSKVAGRPIQVVVGKDYGDTLALTVEGRVDLAYLTPAVYVSARQKRRDLKLLLTDVRGGLDFYTAILVVRADGPIERVEDLKGRRIALVDRESTSGYVYPMRYLSGLGLTPSSFDELRFSGNHRRSLEMLLSRQVDVAALSSNFLEGARAEGIDVSNVRVLARAGVIPQHAVVLTSQLPPDVEQRLVEALLSITSLSDEGRALLPAGMRLNGWKRATPDEFDDVERTMKGAPPSPRY